MKKGIIKILLSVGLFILLLHVGYILWDGLTSKPEISDVIVILGSKVDPDGEPSPRLKSRLDQGLALFRSGYGKKIIVSGGIGKEGFDEARVMAGYLAEHGIAKSAILLDSKGNTTFLTARHCKELMQIKGYSSAIVVSQYYHLTRTKLAFRKAGIENVSSAPCEIVEWRDVYSIPREIAGVYYYWFRKSV